VLDGDPSPPIGGGTAPIFGLCLMSPNGWMDQDATFGTEVVLGPGEIVLDGELALPKRGHSPPIFGPCLLWPNGCMHQDTTWYGGRPESK